MTLRIAPSSNRRHTYLYFDAYRWSIRDVENKAGDKYSHCEEDMLKNVERM